MTTEARDREAPPVEFARTADGVSIAYASSGTGRPLVLMPSAPLGNLTGEWNVPVHRRAFEALGRHFRLLQYDARGSGRSQRDVSDLSFDALVRDLEAVVDASRLDRFVLVGMYLSCTTALAYALRHPERVSHVVVFGGGARGWDAMGSQQTQALLSLIEQDWDTFVASAMHAWLGPGAADVVRLQTDVARSTTTPSVTRRMLQAASAVDLTDRLSELRPPLLVFHRRDVRQVPLETSQQLVEAVADGRLVVLDGSTASILVDDFDVVLRALLAFTGGRPIAADRRGADARPTPLTPREVEVLRLVAQGETNAEIAERLGVSVHTVERHAANLYRKIDARGRADAAAYAVRHGVV